MVSTSFILYFLITFWASGNVKSTFKKYSKYRASNGYTGQEIAQKMLYNAGIYDVTVEHIKGELTDHYDPSNGEKIVIARRKIQAIEARIPAVEPSEGLFDLVFNPTKTGTDVYIELLKSGIDGETEERI